MFLDVTVMTVQGRVIDRFIKLRLSVFLSPYSVELMWLGMSSRTVVGTSSCSDSLVILSKAGRVFLLVLRSTTHGALQKIR